MNDPIIATTARDIRTFGAVAILGAGASMHMGVPGMPQIPDLLWEAVNADPDLRDRLAKEHKWSGTRAKAMIGRDEGARRIAFKEIANSPQARRTFQRQFAELNAERIKLPSPAHNALAELLHRGLLDTVICLNWDTLLETAYLHLYGGTLSPGGPLLFKPHGDVNNLDADWILPGDVLATDDPSILHIKSIIEARKNEYPRLLLSIGYSESDHDIAEPIIRPLSHDWRKVRIGPNPKPDDEIRIALSADRALPLLLKQMNLPEEIPGWTYVRFHNQHTLKYALGGEELGPADVGICPELPEVETAKQRLEISSVAVISGGSGTGKTISAYQVAHKFWQRGWEVLYLSDRLHRSKIAPAKVEETTRVLSALRNPTVILVDNAQTVDLQLLRRLRESVSDKLLAILVFNGASTVSANAIFIDNKRAVKSIAEQLLNNRIQTLQAVREWDHRVGDGIDEEPLEQRILAAEEKATPWAFTQVLIGGEQRTQNNIAHLREQDRADLLLAAVSIGQIATLDKGQRKAWFAEAARAMGKTKAWRIRTTKELRDNKLIVGTDTLRCPHLRFAQKVLQVVFEDVSDPEVPQLIMLLRFAILSDDFPLEGIARLLNELWYCQELSRHMLRKVIDNAAWEGILKRCWEARTGLQRREAAFCLKALRKWHPKHMRVLGDNAVLLGQWLTEVDTDAIPGIAALLRDLAHRLGDEGHEARLVVKEIFRHADPVAVAGSLATITWVDAGGWGRLLLELGKTAPLDWKARLQQALNRDAFDALMERATSVDVYQLDSLLAGLYSIDEALTAHLLYKAAPLVAEALSRHPVAVYTEIATSTLLELYLLGKNKSNRTALGTSLARAHLEFTSSINVNALAAAIPGSTSRREWLVWRDLLSYLRELMPKQVKTMLGKIDVDAVYSAVQDYWAQMPGELDEFIRALAQEPDFEPAHTLVSRYSDKLVLLSPTLAKVAPEIIVKRMRKNRSLKIGENYGSNRYPVAEVVVRVAQVDKEMAIRVAAQNLEATTEFLSRPGASQLRHISGFIELLREDSPTLLERAFSNIKDPKAIGEGWRGLLKLQKPEEHISVIALLNAAASMRGPIAEVAQQVLSNASGTVQNNVSSDT